MLGVRTYEKEYVAACRARIDADVAAYRIAVTGANSGEFESRFFNNLVLVLDYLFVNRLRVVEGKDGNPLNEVRMFGNSQLNNDGKLAPDSTIKYSPAKAVLKLSLGDEIKISESDFLALSNAFFAEIEQKFT